jgi:hypothetical protein
MSLINIAENFTFLVISIGAIYVSLEISNFVRSKYPMIVFSRYHYFLLLFGQCTFIDTVFGLMGYQYNLQKLISSVLISAIGTLVNEFFVS